MMFLETHTENKIEKNLKVNLIPTSIEVASDNFGIKIIEKKYLKNSHMLEMQCLRISNGTPQSV